MKRQKRALAVHDISCFGRCSLTVALPVLSAAGIETSVLPTAVLSTHTGATHDAVVGRVTIERRPLLLVEAKAGDVKVSVVHEYRCQGSGVQ